jgi:hypothetical protein
LPVATRVAWGAWAALGVVLAATLLRPAALLPGNGSWLRRFQTPEIDAGTTIAQEFVMHRSGLYAVDVYPTLDGAQPGPSALRLTLVDITEGSRGGVVRTGMFPVDEAVRTSRLRFAFAPIGDSRNRKYRLEASAVSAPTHIRLRATRGDWYRDGTLIVNGRARFGDLLFQASAPTSSIWRTLVDGRNSAGPAAGRRVLLLLVVIWIVLGGLLRPLLSLAGAPSP